MKNQLIIIGNGFDLVAGLKSTYDDFFNWYFKERIKFKEQVSLAIRNDDDNQRMSLLSTKSDTQKKEQVNFWFELFWIKYEKNLIINAKWSDVETVILEELNKIEAGYDDFYQNRVDLFGEDPTKKVFGLKIATLENAITEGEYLNNFKKRLSTESQDESGNTTWVKEERISSDLLENPNKFYMQTNKELFISDLFHDLRDFEKAFMDFLNQQVYSNPHYIDNSNQLMSELIVREYVERPKGLLLYNDSYFDKRNKFIKEQESKTQILSFNYTHETDDDRFVNSDLYSNVHGDLKKADIIFGIDSHKAGDNMYLLPFTKTYRMMDHENYGFKLKKNLNKIKIFGHGLAEADYSYYQTIFDSVNLYSSETSLYFYYNIYDLGRRFNITETFKQSVFKLIRRYGSTLTNKDHGKNMLHKLIIEGRINIIELNTSFLEERNL